MEVCVTGEEGKGEQERGKYRGTKAQITCSPTVGHWEDFYITPSNKGAIIGV